MCKSRITNSNMVYRRTKQNVIHHNKGYFYAWFRSRNAWTVTDLILCHIPTRNTSLPSATSTQLAFNNQQFPQARTFYWKSISPSLQVAYNKTGVMKPFGFNSFMPGPLFVYIMINGIGESPNICVNVFLTKNPCIYRYCFEEQLKSPITIRFLKQGTRIPSRRI